MKYRAILTLATAFLCGSGIALAREAAQVTTPASDSRITYVGRTLSHDGNVSFDWSGTYFKIRFEGRYLALRVSDTRKNYYNVWVDKPTSDAPDKVFSTFGSDSVVVVLDEEDLIRLYGKRSRLLDGPHRVTIQKRTEATQGRTTLHEVYTRGALLADDGLRQRLIEFVGDSYTCGYGSENSVRTDPFKAETENSNLSYAPIIARYFNADYLLIAHSGKGIARNYGDKDKDDNMPERYQFIFDEADGARWNASEAPYRPQITVIYLCTNDFSTSRQPSLGSFTAKYKKLIDEIKANYGPEHPILCVAGKNDPLMPEYIRTSVEKCGHNNVYYAFLSPAVHNSNSELGASWHPNYKGHIKKAFALIPYISTITGWDMEEKPVK